MTLIRKAIISDYKIISRFISKYWKKNHVLSVNKLVFDEWYKKYKTYNFLIYFNNKKVISLLGFIDYANYSKNTSSQKIWLALWVSKQNSFGAGVKLLRDLENRFKSKDIIALGLTQNAISILKILNYKVGFLNHYYLVNNNIKKFNVIKNPIIKTYIGKDIQLIVSNLELISFNKLNNNLFFDLDKPKQYFINKYLKNKFYKYNIYHVTKNNLKKLSCIFIIRIINVKSSKIIRIVDFAGNNRILKNCYYFFQNILEKNKAEYIDCLNYGLLKTDFMSCGFNELNYKKTIVPNYFEPFKQQNKKIYFAFNENNYRRKKKLIFKGDGDQERPNNI